MSGPAKAVAYRDRLLDGKDWAWICVLLVVGGGLRLGAMNRESFWGDELAQLQFALGPVAEIPAKAIGHQQPCLDYMVEGLVVRLAGTAGAARLPAVLFGTLSLAVFYAVFRGLAGRPVSLAASALMLLCYTHLHFSREARPYAHALFWVGVFWLCWLRAWRVNRPASWALVAVVAFVMLNVRGFDPITLVSACLCWGLLDVGVGWWREGKRPAELLGSAGFRCAAVCGAALLAFGPQVWRIARCSRTLSYRWPAQGRPTWGDESSGFYLQSMVSATGDLLPGMLWSFAALGLILLVGWTRSEAGKPGGGRRGWLAFKPIAGSFVWVHVVAWCGYVAAYRVLNRGIMNPPKTVYFLFLLPGALLLVGVGVVFVARWASELTSPGRSRRRAATILAVGLAVLVGGTDSLVAKRYLTGQRRPDWRGMLGMIDELGSDGDLVFRETDEPFGVYEYCPSNGRGVMYAKDLAVTSTALLCDSLTRRRDWTGRTFLIYSGGADPREAEGYPAGTKVRRFHGGEVIYYDPPRGFLEELEGLIDWLVGLRHPADPALADLHLARAVIAEHKGQGALGALRVAMARALVPAKQLEFFGYVSRRIEAAAPASGKAPAQDKSGRADNSDS